MDIKGITTALNAINQGLAQYAPNLGLLIHTSVNGSIQSIHGQLLRADISIECDGITGGITVSYGKGERFVSWEEISTLEIVEPRGGGD